MAQAKLEHINITVSDAEGSAERLGDLFGWGVRWRDDVEGGHSIHVGEAETYLALYQPNGSREGATERYTRNGAMNHIGVTVDDLDATEAKVRAAGYEPHHHADYEPGRRFYFMFDDAVEVEVVSYA